MCEDKNKCFLTEILKPEVVQHDVIGFSSTMGGLCFQNWSSSNVIEAYEKQNKTKNVLSI